MFSLDLPTGVLYKNNTTPENSIACTDKPSGKEIVKYFADHEDADILIYKDKDIEDVYLRNHA